MTTIHVDGPTGTADDSGMLNAVLASAYALADPAITTVCVPAGLYLLQAPLFIGSYTRLLSKPGVTYRRNASRKDELLRCRNTGPVTGYNGEHDWEIDGGTWDGNRDAVTDGDNVISWSHCRNVVVRNVHVTRAYSYHGIECNATQHVLFEDCLFTDSATGTEALQFDGAFGSGAYPWFGAYDNTPCDQMTVRRCLFRDGISDGIGSHTVIAGHPHTNLVLEDVEIHCSGVALKLRNYVNVSWTGLRISTAGTALELKADAEYCALSDTAITATEYTPPEPPALDPPLGGPEPVHITLYTNDGGSGQHANLPSAPTELFNNTYHRSAADLTGFSQARVIAPVRTAGAPTCRYAIQYSKDQGATWDYLDGVGGPSLLVAAVGLKVGAWVGLAAAAKADVWLRPIGVDGNGTADPAIGSLYVEVR